MPNRHKLGVYLAPHHDPAAWKRYLWAIDPGYVRVLLPGDAPTDMVSQIYQVAPQAVISLRWWDLDDGGDGNKRGKLDQPIASAERDTAEMHRRLSQMEDEARRNQLPFPDRDYIRWNTLNEPPTWEHDKRDAIALYATTFIGKAASYGVQTQALEIAVGHPEDWPPVWEWAKPVFASLAKYGGELAIHEYWQPEGPLYEWTDEEGKQRVDWGALAGRYQHIPYDGKIAVTEAGIEGRIFNRYPPPNVGWQAFVDPDWFAGQMGTYLAKVKKDDRIVTVLPFMTDYQDDQWESFDTLPALDGFVKVLKAMDKDDASNPPTPVELPPVPGDGGSDDLAIRVEQALQLIDRGFLSFEAARRVLRGE